MYAQESLHDSLFMMLYGCIAMLAVVAGLYLWLRRSNGILPDITPPRALRRWTAAFFLMAALSHVWWYVLGVYWLTEDRLVRNITAVTLDHILLVPLVMAMLVRMLQNRRHRLWPWVLAQVPVVVAATVGITRRDEFYGYQLTTYWQVAVMIVFVVYYIYELRQYGRWLRDNYADLEHKEVWQSLLFAVILFVVYEVYFTNPGVMAREYLAQIETLAIITFLVWRVETLQSLTPDPSLKEEGSDYFQEQADEQSTLLSTREDQDRQADATEESIPLALRRGVGGEDGGTDPLGKALFLYCEQPRLYLQYDLTLTQLAETVGTSREALGAWFTKHGDTYNAYINRLRIDHFIRLHREAAKARRSFTVFELAHECGYRSYLSFYTAFKKHKGITVSAWMEDIQK